MNVCNGIEIFFGTVVREGFQELKDLYLILKDSLGALLIVGNGLIKYLDQSIDAINLDELGIAIPALNHAYFSEMNRSMLPKCILIAVSLFSNTFILSSNSFFLCS